MAALLKSLIPCLVVITAKSTQRLKFLSAIILTFGTDPICLVRIIAKRPTENRAIPSNFENNIRKKKYIFVIMLYYLFFLYSSPSSFHLLVQVELFGCFHLQFFLCSVSSTTSAVDTLNIMYCIVQDFGVKNIFPFCGVHHEIGDEKSSKPFLVTFFGRVLKSVEEIFPQRSLLLLEKLLLLIEMIFFFCLLEF